MKQNVREYIRNKVDESTQAHALYSFVIYPCREKIVDRLFNLQWVELYKLISYDICKTQSKIRNCIPEQVLSWGVYEQFEDA